MAEKTQDLTGGMDMFDRGQAEAMARLRELTKRSDLPKAYFVAVPALGPEGTAAVETLACCPTDPDMMELFVAMTLNCVKDWAEDSLAEVAEARAAQEDW